MADFTHFKVLIILMGILLFSCHSNITDRYSEDELVRIMLDAHTLGLIYNRQKERSDSLKMAYYEVLEERYGLNQNEFDALVNGLILNAELYDKVYDRMNKKMEKMEQREMEY